MGTRLTAIGSTVNRYGNTWYQVLYTDKDNRNRIGWIWSGLVTRKDEADIAGDIWSPILWKPILIDDPYKGILPPNEDENITGDETYDPGEPVMDALIADKYQANPGIKVTWIAQAHQILPTTQYRFSVWDVNNNCLYKGDWQSSYIFNYIFDIQGDYYASVDVRNAENAISYTGAASDLVSIVPANAKVEVILLSDDYISLYYFTDEICDSTTLYAISIEPYYAENLGLIWSSSDSDIATVDQNGYVQPKGIGTAVITATAADGGGTYAQCTVDVKEQWYVSIISLSDSALHMIPGETHSLYIKVWST